MHTLSPSAVDPCRLHTLEARYLGVSSIAQHRPGICPCPSSEEAGLHDRHSRRGQRWRRPSGPAGAAPSRLCLSLNPLPRRSIQIRHRGCWVLPVPGLHVPSSLRDTTHRQRARIFGTVVRPGPGAGMLQLRQPCGYIEPSARYIRNRYSRAASCRPQRIALGRRPCWGSYVAPRPC